MYIIDIISESVRKINMSTIKLHLLIKCVSFQLASYLAPLFIPPFLVHQKINIFCVCFFFFVQFLCLFNSLQYLLMK